MFNNCKPQDQPFLFIHQLPRAEATHKVMMQWIASLLLANCGRIVITI